MSDYLDHCPDCVPLPLVFPASCLGPVLTAGKALLTGQPVTDLKCAVHCAETLQLWAVGLWIRGDDHPLAKMTEVFDLAAVIAELEMPGADYGVINWRKYLKLALWLLEQLLG